LKCNHGHLSLRIIQLAPPTTKQGCKRIIKQLRNDAEITCAELFCPDGQYWDSPAQKCVSNPNYGPQTPPLLTATPIPAVIKGFYKWSWSGTPYQGPDDTNIGVTFTGWVPPAASANIPPITNRPINVLSYGVSKRRREWMGLFGVP
jgi:hypothetical protein